MNTRVIRVLLVEDNDGAFARLRDLLAQVEGVTFDVSRAASWDGGRERLAAGCVDLALVSERISGRAGLALIEAMAGSGADVPLILLTDDGSPAAGRAALDAGAVDFLVRRGLTPALLERAIRYATGEARARRAQRASEARIVAEERLHEQAARLQLLAEMSAAFSASALDLDSILETLSRRVSEVLNDICVLRLVSDDGLLLVPAAVWHPDPVLRSLLRDGQIWAHGVHEWFPGVVMQRGEALLIPEFDSEVELQQHPEKVSFFQQHDIHSMLIVPLRVRGEIIGTLSVARMTPDQPYTDEDRDFLQDLADRAAQAVDNARLYRRAVEAEAQHRHLIEQLPAIIFVEALDEALAHGAGTTLYISPQVEAIFGITPDDWMRKANPWLEIIHPDDRATAIAEIERTNQPGDPFSAEYRALRPDGSQVWVASEARIVRDDGGQPRFWQGIISDITERKAVEAALRAAEDKYRTLVEHIPAATFTITLDGRYLYMSPQIERLLGYPAARWDDGAAFWTSIVHPDDLAAVVAEDRRTDATGDPFDMEYRYIAADGRVVWARNQTELLRGPDGTPHCWQGYIIDITERRLAEQRLRETEDKYRTLVEHNPAVIFTASVDPTSTPTYMSPRFEQMLGYPADVWSNGSFWETTVHPDDLDWVVALDRHTDATFEPFEAEYRAIAADGRIVWVHSNMVAIRDEDGAPRFWQGYMIDITARKRAEQLLREAEDQYRTLVEHSPAVIFTSGVDDDSTPLYMSPQIERMLGYPPEAWTSSAIWDAIIHPDDRERVSLLDERTGVSLEPFDTEFRVFANDGRLVWLRNYAVAVRDDDGEPQYWQGYLIDITAQKQAEEAIRFQAQLLETVGQAVIATDMQGRITYWNHAAETLYGWQADDVLGRDIVEIIPMQKTPEQATEIIQRLAAGELWAGEFLVQRKDGSVFPAFVTDSPVCDDDGVAIGVIGVSVDISERKRLEQQLLHQAFHDALTGLPNRNLFLDRTRHALSLSRRNEQTVAVLFLDLDNFKIVNDSLGHDIGDQLLVATAGRILGCLREGDTAARLGGDEFAVLLEILDGAEDAIAVARRLLEALRRPLLLDGHEIFVTPSIGIAVATAAHELAENLLRDADVAMYTAKRNGRARFEIFEPAMGSLARRRLELEHDLRRALQRDELSLHYQPVVRLSDGSLAGFEALLRWEHPTRGWIAPDVFVPVAEETGLIVPVGAWALRQACRQMRAWQDAWPAAQAISVSVNLSGRQFKEPGLADEVARALRETGLAPRCLNLEITETIMMADEVGTSAVLRELEQLGVTLAIDDFGTGYSSLGTLRHFPVESLKIDRSFIDGLGAEPDDSVIVSGVVGLAHGLGLQVVAEGVETADQLARLHELGCDLVQGYYFARPLPADEAAAIVAGRGTWDAGRASHFHPHVPRPTSHVPTNMVVDNGAA